MQVKQCNSHFRKANKRAGKACYLLLCLLLCACANNPAHSPEKTALALEGLKKQFDEHLTEWQALKPRLDRLLKSEQDLSFLITELDKISTLNSQPSKQQLTEQSAFTLAVKEPAIKESAVKETTIKETTIKEPAVKETTIKEPAVKETAVKEPAVKESAVKEPMTLPKNHPKTEIGIHLASYQKHKNLLRGWVIYQQKYLSLLKNKSARTQLISINGSNYQRLIIGPFASTEDALQTCETIKKEQTFCQVMRYEKP